ncbi:hypothetical protein F7734_59000 [Scytonema sp. UIC 10036]|uniref:hypothetical protein n=1 Tax=Scytonema sp. UIC 10036 TaxID=2304196 RepID=UPI0012DABE7A|nr:hypothetical protein [Scytonema sp. UIC 10036]MUH01629.1 hypothetical protein [Scytonema sp. UIC 10036]
MQSEEIPTTRVENKARSIDNKFISTSYQQQSDLELSDRIGANNALTRQASLNPLVRNSLILSILVLLFVASIYYGVINP